MMNRVLSAEIIYGFKKQLYLEEKSKLTIEKYMRDIYKFYEFIGENEVSKDQVIRYKESLKEKGYAVRSINSMLSALNAIFSFLKWDECCVKCIKIQKQIYCTEGMELRRSEYIRLLQASENNPRLYMIMSTICGTGIRISELKHFTVEAVKSGEITVLCKNKVRVILIPRKLKKLLLEYSRKVGIKSGIIFRTRNGKPVDRSNIWKQMKKLCETAGINPSKVFPHNLRKLFARTFYRAEKDIAKLADILGHSNINTTRIYIISTEFEHRKKIEKLGLVV